MKSLSPQLLAFLETSDSYNRADLFLIELVNGQIITATTAQQIVFFGSPLIPYYPSVFGVWERGPVKTAVNFTPKSEDMTLTVVADNSVIFPVAGGAGALNLPFMNVIRQGLLDAAKVWVFTIYWPFGEPSSLGVQMGGITTFVGQIASVEKTGRTKATFRVADMTYLLNINTPPNVIQSGCRYSLFDHGCTLNRNNFLFNNSVAANSNNFYINLATSVINAPNYNSFTTFSQGEVIFTSGANNGLRYYIKSQISNTQIQLAAPLKFAAQTGDTFQMLPGCDKTENKCLNQFNNLINIGAFPLVPNPETAL